MWKNIFLESCLLSALIFGGFYINAKFIKEELYKNEEKTLARISGAIIIKNNISGKKSENLTNISGAAFSIPPKLSNKKNH
tara:strand:- start:820 stop:1062 length:243 start_codon:yes stop_codon:yes gene_type:complete